MHKSVKNMVLVWGKTVHNIRTTCALSTTLCTPTYSTALGNVHNPRQKSPALAPFVPRLIPHLLGRFVSVTSLVIPTIHTTYKENDKSKILKSYYLYTGGF
jgi:hypothetical protein